MMGETAEDREARKMAAAARDIAIENRTWRLEHEKRCKELMTDFRKMVDEISSCVSTLRRDLNAAIQESQRARNALSEKNSALWLRISWGMLGSVGSALVMLLVAIVKGWI